MKMLLLALSALLAVCGPAFATTQCHVGPVTIPHEWISMQSPCRQAMRQQIQTEVGASLMYLSMGAHFSKDSVNRPGFAKLFFEAASEEREHALKLIEYLLMRGELTSDVTSLITIRPPEKKSWLNGTDALKHALQLETSVTNSIREVIRICEEDKAKPDGRERENGFNDYHLVDYLAGDFLDEQYKGQRDLAGKASTLMKMMERHSALGEFIFDKKLLGMDL